MDLVTDYELIKELRGQKGLSQSEFSKEVGIKLGTIKSLETGRIELNEENAEILSVFFDVKISDFYIAPKVETKVITVAINKGGAGKSTVSSNLGYVLAEMGKKILLIDSDSQMNLSRSYGFLESNPDRNFFKAFEGEDDIRNHISKTEYKNIDMVLSSIQLASIEKIMNSMSYRERRMETIIKNLIDEGIYDYIIIDTNPSLGMLNTSILHASDEVLIPLEPSQFGIEGLDMFIEHYEQIKKYQPKLNILGILLNKVETNTIIGQDAYEVLNAVYPELLLKTKISKDTTIQKAQWNHTPLLAYVPNSNSRSDFIKLGKEVLKIVKNR